VPVVREPANSKSQLKCVTTMTIQNRNILIVTAHPEQRSFNHALTESATSALRAAGHDVVLSDLYAENFDASSGPGDFTARADADHLHYQNEQTNAVRTKSFAPDIAREQAKLAAADVVIFQFPLWWGGPPAILKGWLDRVLAYGFAYVDGYRFDTGLFRGRHAILSVTTGGTPARFSDDGVYGPIEQLLRPIKRGALEYMGFEVAPSFVCYGAPRMSEEDRQAHLSLWAKQVLEIARLPTDRSRYPADPLSLVEDGAWARGR